ncbi:MAG: alpha/beta hydrolase [Alphaproteobacteria bacterium]|jgi:esterase|nr:alpha/beta hydrolase [Alphaproteobacteria bacterium]
MYLNAFAHDGAPLDMTGLEEFKSLLSSAADLSIPHSPNIAYQSHNIVLRRQRFHFLEWGAPDAPPIVLLHGGHQSAHSWDLVSLHLARKYRVFALDQRGHGDSEWSRDANYSNNEMSLDAEALMDALELERPILMGHSMGGRNSLLLTRRDPSRLGGLVVVDIGPEISEEGRKLISAFVRNNEEFDNLEHFAENVRKYDPYRSMEHIERTVKYNMLCRADGKYISKCDSTPRRVGIQTGSSEDAVSLDDARAFDIPTLIVRGETSKILTPESAVRFKDALPQGELVTVPECGHNVHSQNTHGFIEAIGPFLAKLT